MISQEYVYETFEVFVNVCANRTQNPDPTRFYLIYYFVYATKVKCPLLTFNDSQ